MRILSVGSMYPPQYLGGYELIWQSAVAAERAAGHEVRVLTSDLDLGADEPDDADVHRELRWYWRDFEFPRLSLRERVRLERANAAVLDRHVAELQPDVVAWWAMGGMSLSLIERVRRAGLPAVALVIDDWLDYGPRVDAWLKLGARVPGAARVKEALTGLPAHVDFGGAARYVFVSEATRRRAFQVRGELPDTGLAHAGIHPLFLQRRAPEQEWRWRLGYVGRLDERKGVDTAVAALAELPDEATLTVVGGGDPSERARLDAQAAAAGVGARLRFTGPRDREGLAAAYGEADVVVFPVRWEEPWGLVPLEAMAVGRPVVATGRGGSGEYLRADENALLFEAGDASALAAAIRRLAEQPDLRARLRAAGLELAAQYTEEAYNDAVESELRAAAHDRSRHTARR